MIRHLNDSLDYLAELQDSVFLAREGIATLTAAGELAEAVAYADPARKSDEDVQRAKEKADLAEQEVEKGFPLLHAQAASAIWTTLEHLVVSFLADHLERLEPAQWPQRVRKLRFRVGDFLDMDPEDRPLALLEVLQNELGSPLRTGINRFEGLLSVFGWSGPVPERISECLFELQQVRNVHAHRRGHADKRLVDACPWLALKRGEYVHVRDDDVGRYYSGAIGYVGVLAVRAFEKYGEEVDPRIANSVELNTKRAGRRPDEQLDLGGADGT